MLQVLGNPRPFCDGLNRRQAMTAGALSVLGGSFNLPSLLAMEERRLAGGPAAKAKSVLLLYLHGGAPTQDMLDMKPAAPVEIRGEFHPVATSTPGIHICEHLPKMATWMHRAAIVRTVHHDAGCHNTLPGFTGSEQFVNINDPVPKDFFPPSMGSVCEYLRPDDCDVPHYAALPTYLGWGYNLRRPGPQGGFLGKRYDPLCGECLPVIDPKPSPPESMVAMWLGAPQLMGTTFSPEMTIDRLNSRQSLLVQLDEQHRQAEAHGAIGNFGRVRKKAFDLLTSSKLKAAFNLESEDPKLRERYGQHLFGASALIGRRLIEAGVRFVDVYWDGYSSRSKDNQKDPYWDTHDKNFVRLKQLNLPKLDQTYDALLSDLEERGLLDETLVVMMSDFGRTPRVNNQAGRDHWTSCYSVLLAGAGIRGGTLCGTSDHSAAYVKDRPVRPADICATIYQCLGIDPEMTVLDRSNRPVPIANGGQAIREILA